MTDYTALARATIGAGKRLKPLYRPEQTRQMRMDAHQGKNVLQNLQERREVCELNIPGFFPTPRNLARRMVEMAEIEPGLRCLEPSAGIGNIAREMAKAMSNQPVCVEWNQYCYKILVKEFTGAIYADVMADEWRNQVGFEPFERIVANPPFEKNKDWDHIQRYYQLLAPGGIMVAITSEHAWLSDHKVERQYIRWFEMVSGKSEKLPPGTFEASERPTGVSTRLVVIRKE